MRFVAWATLVGLVLVAIPAFGQCPAGQTLAIPVSLDGNTPVLSARINGIEARLIFDTGGASTMLMSGAVAKFGLDAVPTPPDAHYMSYGVPVDMNFTHVKEFSYAGQTWRDETLPITDGGDGIDGFVGQSHMRQDDVEIDLAGGVIRYFAPNDCPDDRVAYWANKDAVSVVDLEDRNRIFGTVVVNGVPLRALFDTGSSFSNFAASGAAKAGVTPDTPGVLPVAPQHGLNRLTPQRAWLGTFDDFRVGRETIRKAKFKLIEKPNPSADMILGADFFVTHRVLISKRRHKLWFTYNGGTVFGSDAVSHH